MNKIALAVLACVTLSSCSRAGPLPDRSVPHRLAEDTTVFLWVRGQDGKFVKTKAWIPADRTWVADELVLYEQPLDTK